jgi:hypothetical protein
MEYKYLGTLLKTQGNSKNHLGFIHKKITILNNCLATILNFLNCLNMKININLFKTLVETNYRMKS